jgi:hypothetical protein
LAQNKLTEEAQSRQLPVAEMVKAFIISGEYRHRFGP